MGSKHFFFFLFFRRPFYIDVILFLTFLLFVFVSVEVTLLQFIIGLGFDVTRVGGGHRHARDSHLNPCYKIVGDRV